MAQDLPSEIVEQILALSSAVATRPSEVEDATVLSRRGLQNYQNTCFLNCVLQCLLHCPPFFATVNRVQSTLQQLDPALGSLGDKCTSASGSQDTNAIDLTRAIPITHELLVFAALCRRKEKRLQQKQQQQQLATEAASAQGTVTSTNNVAEPAVASDVAVSTQMVETSNVASSAAAVSIEPAKTSAKPTKAKKSKAATGDRDDAYLDAILRQNDPAVLAAEEERKREKNRKKKERQRLAAKKAAQDGESTPADANEQNGSDAEEQQLAKSVQQLQIPSSVAESTSLPTLTVGKKKKKKKSAGDITTSHTTEDVTVQTNQIIPAAENAPEEPVEEAAGESTLTDEADAANAAGAGGSTLSRKQQRVHRVEDEDDWEIPIAKGKGSKGKVQPLKATKQTAAPAASPNKPSTKLDSASTKASSSSVSPGAAEVVVHGVVPTAAPFLPSFPHLLRAFRSHRQGQQEDAQELLQILCENVQEEWNRWTAPWRSASSTDTYTAAAAADSEDSWNEVGKHSRAIRVTSNLAFVHTPLSRLFSGRVRTQLSVANRATDTMSFQPFWSLHLDIDDAPAEMARRAQEEAALAHLTPAAARQARHKRKTPAMSVSKALERYMCPSEISGYKKKGAAQTQSYYDPPATTRALHMHALDSHSLPTILVLHLKRFEQSEGGSMGGRPQLHKSMKHVKFDRSLHLPPSYLSTAAQVNASASSAQVGSGVWYNLAGVVVHHGVSMQGGHYTAFTRDLAAEAELKKDQEQKVPAPQQHNAPATNKTHRSGKTTKHISTLPSSSDDDSGEDTANSKNGVNGHSTAESSPEVWYHCDDIRITPVAAHTVYAQAAYLLFYVIDEEQTKGQHAAHTRK